MSNALKEKIGLVSHWSAFSGIITGTAEEEKLKTTILFYDQVILPWNGEIVSNLIETMSENHGIEKKDLRDTWLSIDDIAPDFNSYQKNVLPILTPVNEILSNSSGFPRGLKTLVEKKVANQLGISVYKLKKLIQQDYGYLRTLAWEGYSMLSISFGHSKLWALLQPIRPCALIAFDEIELKVSQSMFNIDKLNDVSHFTEYLNVQIPSFTELNWATLIKLRKDRRIQKFREFIWSNKINSQVLIQRTQKELINAFEENIPVIKKEILKGIISEIPLPLPINPLSISQTLKDLYDGLSFKRKYDWLIFLHEIEKTKNNPKRSTYS